MRSFSEVHPPTQRLSRHLQEDFADMAGFGQIFMGLLGLFQGENTVRYGPDLPSQKGPNLAPYGIADGLFLPVGSYP
jgi:hypothetical protein